MSSGFTELSTACAPSPTRPSHEKPLTPNRKRHVTASNTKKLIPIDYGGKIISQKKDLVEAVRKITMSNISKSSGKYTTKRSNQNEYGTEISNNTKNENYSKSNSSKEVETLENGVHLNARKLNEHRLMVKEKSKELARLTDELKQLQIETNALDEIKEQKTDGSRQINRIKDEIDMVQQSMDEKLFLQKQLEHMHNRLDKSHQNIHSFIHKMEEAVKTCQSEYEEAKVLHRQIEAGRSQGLLEYMKLEEQIKHERKQRNRELTDRESEARNAKRMEAWREKRIRDRAEMAAMMRGDLSQEEEDSLIKTINEKSTEIERFKISHQDYSTKVQKLDDLFTKLKQITGALTIDDIVEKVTEQSTTRISLNKEKTAAETLLSDAKFRKEKLNAQFNELKATGVGSIEVNRELYNRLEDEITKEKNNCKLIKASTERLNAAISTTKQGVTNMCEKLLPYDYLWKPHDATSLQMSGNKDLDNIVKCETKLTKMLEIVSQGGTVNGMNDSDGSRQLDDLKTFTATSHENNLRVHPKLFQSNSEDYFSKSTSDDTFLTTTDEDAEEIIPTRQHLKRSSSRQVIEETRRQFTESIKKKGAIEPNNEINESKLSPTKKGNMKLMKGKSEDLISNLTIRDDAMTKSKAFLTQMPDFLS